MATLVGDVIVEAREIFPDPAQFLSRPTATGFVGSNTGGTLPNSAYFFIVTALNQWGETLGTSEATYTVTGGNIGSIVFTPAPFLPVGAISYRVYIANTTGGEQGYFSSVGTAPLTVTTLTGLTPAVPPTRSSAMLPDTDGGFVSAASIYRWLNDGLQEMGRIGGGIPSITGVQAVSGTAMYRIQGGWIRFTNYWFDGWSCMAGRRGDIFLHNVMTSIPGLVSLEEFADTSVVQFWPQPNRTGATSTLSAGIGLTDATLTLASATNFLAIGLLQIDSEIIGYSGISGNVVSGLMRGLGGTSPAIHAISALTTELNLRFAGFRQPNTYSVGQSLLSIPLLPGWSVPLSDYLVAQYKKAEQDLQTAMAIEKDFEKSIDDMARKFRGKTNPGQIGGNPREAYGGTINGGFLIS